VAKSIIADLLGAPTQRSCDVRYWEGSLESPGMGRVARFTLVLRSPGALRRMLLPPSEQALGEAYLRDDVDLLGDAEAATSLAEAVVDRLRSPAALARLVPRLLLLPTDDRPSPRFGGVRTALPRFGRRHTRARDGAAVRFHYDLGNDFYALWLDQRMLYSCAYFPTGSESLDAAQAAKLDYICRKLRLKPGERLLDIGCGWGGLVQYAAERYGVQATGITLSKSQAALARERLAAAGLSDRCQVELRDYRDRPRGVRFDKIASVGMFEHVGRARLRTYFDRVHRLLEPGGLFLNHGIVEMPWARPGGPLGLTARLIWRQGGFINRHVFPDGELVTPGEVIHLGEVAGFETRDLECLREHYVVTLRHWVRRLEARHDEAVRLVGEPTYRIWRLFMAGSARGFATGSLSVIQTILSKPAADGSSRLPLTRADLYREDSAPTTQAVEPWARSATSGPGG
jgi:cyclopropane-fatty-acyl-phospholipid synthase